jgi:hypothetical protein
MPALPWTTGPYGPEHDTTLHVLASMLPLRQPCLHRRSANRGSEAAALSIASLACRTDSSAICPTTGRPTSTDMWIVPSAFGPDVQRYSSAGPSLTGAVARKSSITTAWEQC